jgi:DNA-directed RNA polymerase subunit RPC12/RpoP
MPVFTYKCPSCAGPVLFSPDNGKFTCGQCGSIYEESYLKTLDDAAYDRITRADGVEYGKAEEGAQLNYSCPSCGAEIVTDQTTAATTCYYCHNPVVLTGRLVAEYRPDALLPFAYNNKAASDLFLSWIRKKKYVPKAFAAKESVRNISGVYFPYWLADYGTRARFAGEGRIVTTVTTATSIVTTTKHYKVTRDADISFRNMERSALKKADRKLADGVHPYRTDKMIAFEPSYLSGYLAEKRDITAGDVRSSVENEIRGLAKPLLTAGTAYTSVTGETTVDFMQDKYRYTLLPAWILTYSGPKGKTYYYAMNGQTGTVCGILPVNTKKLFLHSAALGAIVCGIVALALYYLV